MDRFARRRARLPVKLDAVALEPGATYYYRFSARGARIADRPHPHAPPRPTRVRLAIVSCSNFPFGFFNVYARIAARADLNAVLHLGDYIYEYANGHYGNRNEGDGRPLDRVPFPDREIVTSTTIARATRNIARIPTCRPHINIRSSPSGTIVANDACRDGAEIINQARDHGPSARQRRFARGVVDARARGAGIPDYHLYREFAFGDLADLMMLDTRLGRDGQAAQGDNLAVERASRQIACPVQEEWLFENLRVQPPPSRGRCWGSR